MLLEPPSYDIPRAAEQHVVDLDASILSEASVEMRLSDLDSVEEKARRQRTFTAMVHRLIGSDITSIHISDVIPLFQRMAQDSTCHEVGGLSLGESTLAQLKRHEDDVLKTQPDLNMTLDELWGLFEGCLRPTSDLQAIEGHSDASTEPTFLSYPSPHSLLPRAIPGSPFLEKANALPCTNESETTTTPPRPISRPKSPPSFGRKRTTPIMSDSTTARRAFEASRARSLSSTEDGTEGGMVGDIDEGPELLNDEQIPELEHSRASPLDVGEDQDFLLSKAEMEAYGSASVYYPASSGASDSEMGDYEGANPFLTKSLHKRISVLTNGASFNNVTPRKELGEAFHTPMTSIKRNLNANNSRSTPSPSLGGFGSRESPQMTPLQDSWSPLESSGYDRSRGNSIRLSPRRYRDIQEIVKKLGLPNETFRKICRLDLEASSESDENEELSSSEIARITQVVVGLAVSLKEKDEELRKSHRDSEHQLEILQRRIDELIAELKNKKKTLAASKLSENEYLTQIETLETEIERLQNEIARQKLISEALKCEVEERTEINLRLTRDLKWKEEEISKSRLEMEVMQKDKFKSTEEKTKLEDNVQLLTDQVTIFQQRMNDLREVNMQMSVKLDSVEAGRDDALSEATDMAAFLESSPRSRGTHIKSLSAELHSAAQTDVEPCDLVQNKSSDAITCDPPPSYHPTKTPTESIETQTEGSTIPVSTSSTQTPQVLLVDQGVSPSPDITAIDFTSQTDPKLGQWRPMPRLSDSDRSTDVVFPQTVKVDSASQCYVTTLTVGVQAGGEVARRDLERHGESQTEETVTSLEERERVAEMLRERCEALQAVVEGLEGQSASWVRIDYSMFFQHPVEQFDSLKGSLDELEQSNANLRDELRKAHGASQDNRRRLNLRKHYDDEVERWLAGMRQQLDAVNESVATAKDALDINAGRQVSALARIEELENELEHHKELNSILSAPANPDNGRATPETWSSPSHTRANSSNMVDPIFSTITTSTAMTAAPLMRLSPNANIFSVPRWAVPLLVYTVVVWNAGANFGAMTLQPTLEAFSTYLYAAGIIPSPTFFGVGSDLTGQYATGVTTPMIDNSCRTSFFGGLFDGDSGMPPM
ncbi:hypothetical protein HDU67_010415 [Dinochytrium kinnereticum]|nr:hypothetical protein HDU67_010415 [Dinochytrium kinnereticum]